jgi:hypothetical protein
MAMSAEQAAAMLNTLRTQVEELANALEASRLETADLRAQTERSIQSVQDQCDAARASVKVESVESHMRLIDEKVNRPPVFDGDRKQVRGWARSVKAYLDSRYPGFRKMLTIIERAEGPSNEIELQSSGWRWAIPANKSLYNMLISYTKGEAQIMLENSDPDEGFECWRKLIQHYDPQGGDNELTCISTLLSVPRCKRLNDIITTVEAWEKEWAQYCDRTKEALPERWKVSLLLRMIPVENEREIRLRYVKSKDITYSELRENLFAWVQQNAIGATGMHIGSMSASEAQLDERRLLSLPDHDDNDDDDDNLENYTEINLLKQKYEDDLNALRVKGGKAGGKNRGRKGTPRGSASNASSGATSRKFTGDCGYCKRKGHMAKDCRKRMADLKAKGGGANSLDAECGALGLGCMQCEEDEDDNQLFAPLRSLCCEMGCHTPSECGGDDYDYDIDLKCLDEEEDEVGEYELSESEHVF